jgi:NAD(P)-dependent dehydrogenase (short-subunit alcohol dehydrogenase family)
MATKHNIARTTRIVALDYPEIKYNTIIPGYIKIPLIDAHREIRTNALIKINDWTPI